MTTPSKPFTYAPLALALTLVWLWFQLINQLRIEWALNSQYSYGWAVPFLCALLLWRNLSCPVAHVRGFQFSAPLPYLLGGLAALAYLPTRLLQEANPDWRLVSWALAGVVILITLVVAPALLASGKTQLGGSGYVFPVLYFLVAVPWPTVVEAPLIQALTRFNASVTIELLNFIGIPALQRGNVIEVSTGLVGIDEACSGIRSFQATLMISLFCGAWYRLATLRRMTLVCAGFGLAMLFNLARTVLLVTVAAKQGVPAIAKWHDPAGVIILLGCFGGLWLVSIWLTRNSVDPERANSSAPDDRNVTPTASSPDGTGFPVSLRLLAPALCGWILLAEVATQLWYRSHEKSLSSPLVWTVVPPNAASGFKELPITERTSSILRYDAAQNFAWNDGDVTRWQVIYLQWNAGRVAAHLARNHTPEVCLTAAGHQLQQVSDLFRVTVRDLELPFRRYTFTNEGGAFHVFYSLREDRLRGDRFTTESLTVQNRFAAVRAGRRNLGQRSIEIAVWGIPDAAQAEAALRQKLEELIVLP